jgi:hypothetical protein
MLEGLFLVQALYVTTGRAFISVKNLVIVSGGIERAHLCCAILVLPWSICNVNIVRVAGVTDGQMHRTAVKVIAMQPQFAAGDDLIFQLESGFGLLRVLAVDVERQVWHLMAYEELFPDVESAERALAEADSLHVRKAHMALTNRAFERTPAARLGNRPVADTELAAYTAWADENGEVSDRSALLMLGMR